MITANHCTNRDVSCSPVVGANSDVSVNFKFHSIVVVIKLKLLCLRHIMGTAIANTSRCTVR